MPGLLFYFLTFLAVYLATMSLLDAVADQKCGCLTMRRLNLRTLIILLLYVTTLALGVAALADL